MKGLGSSCGSQFSGRIVGVKVGEEVSWKDKKWWLKIRTFEIRIME